MVVVACGVEAIVADIALGRGGDGGYGDEELHHYLVLLASGEHVATGNGVSAKEVSGAAGAPSDFVVGDAGDDGGKEEGALVGVGVGGKGGAVGPAVAAE